MDFEEKGEATVPHPSTIIFAIAFISQPRTLPDRDSPKQAHTSAPPSLKSLSGSHHFIATHQAIHNVRLHAALEAFSTNADHRRHMFRRAVVRAARIQPSRYLSNGPPSITRLAIARSGQPTTLRSFHQARIWRADENKIGMTEEEAREEELGDIESADAVEAAEVAASAAEVAQAASEVAEEAAMEPDVAAEEVSFAAAESAQAAAASAAAAAAATAPEFRQPQSRGNFLDQSRESSEKPPSNILYVGNLFFEVTAQQLEAEFSNYGRVTNSRVVTDARGLSKGFGYIEFESQEAAAQAVQKADQMVFQGRRMAVQFHVRRERSAQGGSRDSRPPAPPSKTLFIGNMSYQMSDRDLNDLFREIRDVLDVRVAIDRRSGQPRGFAHADFVDIAAAEKAKAVLEKKVVYGRELRIDFSGNSSRSRQAE